MRRTYVATTLPMQQPSKAVAYAQEKEMKTWIIGTGGKLQATTKQFKRQHWCHESEYVSSAYSIQAENALQDLARAKDDSTQAHKLSDKVIVGAQDKGPPIMWKQQAYPALLRWMLTLSRQSRWAITTYTTLQTTLLYRSLFNTALPRSMLPSKMKYCSSAIDAALEDELQRKRSTVRLSHH